MHDANAGKKSFLTNSYKIQSAKKMAVQVLLLVFMHYSCEEKKRKPDHKFFVWAANKMAAKLMLAILGVACLFQAATALLWFNNVFQDRMKVMKVFDVSFTNKIRTVIW